VVYRTPQPADLNTLARQIGRRPHGALAVAHRCPVGHPGVLLTYPLRRRTGRLSPFPSQFWLTCPRLSQQLSNLERNGVIDQMQHRLMASAELQEQFTEDHRRCIAHRWSLLSEADRHAVHRNNLSHVFARRGIGGVKHWMSIKCLHLHYAHHLTLGDTVGRLLAGTYGVEPCTDTAASYADQ